ncbi:MAG: hypothetical protein ACKVZH_04885 [Blastocatellia bacterium]
MIWNFASKLLLLACLFGWSAAATQAPTKGQTKPLVVFTTAPKLIAAKLKLADGSTSTVRGRATLTVVKANEDDSLTGTLVYLMPNEARLAIAKSSNRQLADVPANVTQKELTVNFQRGTACPVVKLQFSAKEAEVGNATLQFDKAVLEVQETQAPINQLFCSWTRQLNVKRQRLGIIAAINRLITVEEDVENQTMNP